MAVLPGVSDDELRWAYAHCTALLAPSLEDFGLTPLEAGAFGKPTLALRGGGYLDTIDEGVTGDFFARAEAADIARAVVANRTVGWDAEAIVRHGAALRRGDVPHRDQGGGGSAGPARRGVRSGLAGRDERVARRLR